METNQRNKISKFLSLILRHTPEKIGLVLDDNGWADVEELITSGDRATAEKVGNRRGEAVILVVRSKAMYNDGFAFFVSDNGVWLTDHVPVKYIDL